MTDTPHADAGHGVTIALRLAEGLKAPLGIEDGVPVGVLIKHECAARKATGNAGGGIVEDFIPVHPDAAARSPWVLESRDPITISPSVKFTCCGLHGFVRGGKWVPA